METQKTGIHSYSNNIQEENTTENEIRNKNPKEKELLMQHVYC